MIQIVVGVSSVLLPVLCLVWEVWAFQTLCLENETGAAVQLRPHNAVLRYFCGSASLQKHILPDRSKEYFERDLCGPAIITKTPIFLTCVSLYPVLGCPSIPSYHKYCYAASLAMKLRI